jgi:hypothetical protein
LRAGFLGATISFTDFLRTVDFAADFLAGFFLAAGPLAAFFAELFFGVVRASFLAGFGFRAEAFTAFTDFFLVFFLAAIGAVYHR